MADLDTTSKRRSSLQFMQPPVVAALLVDGTISTGDRAHISLMYSGIAAAAPVTTFVKDLIGVGFIPFAR